MRHRKNRFKLSKPTDARVALVRNQVAALFEHGYINTTFTRAKIVQQMAEKMITQAKRGDLGSVRQVSSNLPTKPSLRALLRKVVPNMTSIASGYTQIAKLGYRRGDGALLVRLSIRNYPESEAQAG